MTDYCAKSKKNSKSNCQNRGRAILSLLIACSVICLGVIYVIQTNGLVGGSYQMRQLKQRLADLQMKNQELEMKSAQAQSPANLEKLVEKLDLVNAQNIVYLGKPTELAGKNEAVAVNR